MAEDLGMAFYNRVLAHNRLPDDYERDEQGVWRLKAEEARRSISRASFSSTLDTRSTSLTALPHSLDPTIDNDAVDDIDDVTSASSTTVEVEVDNSEDRNNGNEDGPNTDTIDDDIAVTGAAAQSGGKAPDTTRHSFEPMLAGVGGELGSLRFRTTSSGLETLHDEFQARFVDFRKNKTLEAINAAMDNRVHFANNIEPYRLSVAMHDDLSQSNGLARLNEERAAICVAMNGGPCQLGRSHLCHICALPFDPYTTPHEQEKVFSVGLLPASRHLCGDLEQQDRRVRTWARAKRTVGLLAICVIILACFLGVSLPW